MAIIEKSSKIIEKIGPSFTFEPFGSQMDTVIEDVLEDHGKNKFRKGTILIPKILIWLILGITLRRDLNYESVLGWLLSEYRWTGLNMPKKIVETGTISHARIALGVAVIRDLFYRCVAKFKAFVPDFYGFVTVMFDGSSLTMPDTESNEKKFGKHKSGRGKSAFPQMRVVALLVLSARLIIDLAYAPCKGKKPEKKHSCLKS